jgi:CRP-like cAMP-binding protein
MREKNIELGEIGDVYLFEALNDEQLNRILETSHPVTLPAKTVLFEAGQPARRFYMLRKGQIKLCCLSAGGDEKVVEIINPPQTFAEAILFMREQNYPLSAQAVSDCLLYSFEMDVFRQLLKESTETCFQLMAIMSRRLHQRIHDINNLTLHNATYRLVVYLLDQLPDGVLALSAIHLSTPKNIIASRLSIQPETLSRILKRLSTQGLIHVEANNITLVDVQGLRRLL